MNFFSQIGLRVLPGFLSGLFWFTSLVAQNAPPPRPKRVLLFFIDGLHREAPERVAMPVLKKLIPEGCYAPESWMVAPHHPTVGEYGRWYTCSFPNPVLHQGSLFVKPENTMIQELFGPGEKSAFYVNTNAYASLSRGFTFTQMDPQAGDMDLTDRAIDLMKSADPAFFRLHLQTPGNEGRYLSYTDPAKPYYRNLYGPGSPYVAALQRADSCLGRVVDYLKSSGKWETTLLVVSSDQGQSKIGWHPVADPDSWCTPMLMIGPGMAKGRRLAYAEHTDLMHTLASRLGKSLPVNGGSGEPDRNFLAEFPDRSRERFPLLKRINEQMNQYNRLRAQIQLRADQDLYSSSYLTFLENELLTPEPFYHLDRFTEWYKARDPLHLASVNSRILGQMQAFLGKPGDDASAFDPLVIRELAERVSRYYDKGIYPKVKFQSGHFHPDVFADKKHFRWPTHNDWNQSTFFAGLSYWARYAGDARALERIRDWANRDDYKPMIWDKDLGNNHLAGDVYLDLYDLQGESRALHGIRSEVDRYLGLPYEGQTRWWWCDALFMAPPTFLHLSRATGEARYRNFAHEKWAELTRELLDPKEQLFYRDAAYIFREGQPKTQSPTGKKIFWGRGNGWVLAGTARMLMQMDKTDSLRPYYLDLFRKMAKRIRTLQEPNGCWTVSLYDKASFPKPETSSTALFCFALAWGVREGVLERKDYDACIRSAWKALVERVTPDGKLGFVQAVGHDPRDIDADHTDAFGLGAFLFAAAEMDRYGVQIR